MPFIRGRYHMNPIVGQTLEAAREAEAAMQALEHASKSAQDSDDGENASAKGGQSEANVPGPIHRVEIEAAELVPSHSGLAQRGFVARVHRHAAGNSEPNDSRSVGGRGQSQISVPRPAPETHVFADHRDLTNFLSDELGKDCGD
ncbi:MAG: hypothetical protein ACRD59_12555 [Candidatus Acidiferrales bacterium]